MGLVPKEFMIFKAEFMIFKAEFMIFSIKTRLAYAVFLSNYSFFSRRTFIFDHKNH